MKSKNLSLVMSLLTVMLLVLTGPFSTLALEDNSMPDIENEKKSLTVYFYVQKIGVDTPLDGAEIGIYRIADLKTSYGSANYTVLDRYSSLKKTSDNKDVTFEGISVTESIALAKQFADITDKPEMTAVTDENGMCRFDDLEQGMYLVRELSASGEAKKYQLFEPYMISVPLAFSDVQSGNRWQYDVLSEPKTKVSSGSHSEMSTGTSEVSNPEFSVPESSKPSEPERSQPSQPSKVSQPSQSSQPDNPIFTGDTSSGIVIAMLGVMFASLAVALMTKNKKGADDNE